MLYYGGVAQLGEHLPCKQGVVGSNPFISIRYFKYRKAREEIEFSCQLYLENRICENILYLYVVLVIPFMGRLVQHKR